MNAFVTSILLSSTEVMWAILAKLVTKPFLERLITNLAVAGLEKLSKSTANQFDDKILADVKEALNLPKE